MKIILLSPLVIVVISFLVFKVFWRPSNDRDWELDQALLPFAEIDGSLVSIHNIRNFSYNSTTDYTVSYYDKTYDISKLKNVYYIVEPFSASKNRKFCRITKQYNQL